MFGGGDILLPYNSKIKCHRENTLPALILSKELPALNFLSVLTN